LRKSSRDGLAGKARPGACDVGMVNPFLDRPVSANGQEQVAMEYQ
jgi:hypothetical protein